MEFTLEVPHELPVERRGEHWYLQAPDREVRLSNLDKVFWPQERYTKGDLLAYYYNVAPTMLPYLVGRPLTMRRMPDGIEGHEFYEKNAPSHTPDWVPRCRVDSSESEGGAIDFLMADDVASLEFVVNLGCIEFHPLHSRCDAVDRPDYLFFDLDPHEPATFADVLVVAHHVHAALDALDLPAYAKTSGKTGMQIYVPIERGPTHAHTRAFVGAIGRAIRDADPAHATMEPSKPKRAGKVFIDHNMNRFGANIAAVYSVRPMPGATVGTPLTWEEVASADVRPGDFTIANLHGRLAEVGELFDGLLSDRVDLVPLLERFGIADAEEIEAPTELDIEAPTDPDVVRSRLATYETKRDFAKTPEPAGGDVEPAANRFVIQKHAATRLHYDLRLERDGVLLSWAVPKGLPTEPGERRLAVRTEDHPMQYLDFEAWIPEGEYGGGEMRIFDSGTYEAPEWEPKKMTIRLHGQRVRGEFHLVETRQSWLIFLSKRSAAIQPDPPPPMRPMLAEGGHQPFGGDGWTFEPKLDGVRTLAYVATDGTRLFSRTGRDQTATYPELANLATYTNAVNAVLDGEIVAVDTDGHPSFGLLQQRMNLSGGADVERARRKTPVRLYVFDILWLDGSDLTHEPLTERRRILGEIVTYDGPVAPTMSVDTDGEAFFEAAKGLGLEGVIAKRLDSTYEPGGRSSAWRKIKAMQSMDCVVLGWTPGSGSRTSTFGALLLGAYRNGRLTWIGQVGTGFTSRTLAEIHERLEDLEVATPASDDPALAKLPGARWVEPSLVCEVDFLEVTEGGKLRAPSFKGFRADKEPTDCTLLA